MHWSLYIVMFACLGLALYMRLVASFLSKLPNDPNF
jgi:hypothetical protein